MERGGHSTNHRTTNTAALEDCCFTSTPRLTPETRLVYRDQDQDRDQALAFALAALLLTGTALLMSCWVGPLAAFAAVAVLVVVAYAAPGIARRLAIRRAVRELLRSLPGA